MFLPAGEWRCPLTSLATCRPRLSNRNCIPNPPLSCPAAMTDAAAARSAADQAGRPLVDEDVGDDRRPGRAEPPDGRRVPGGQTLQLGPALRRGEEVSQLR